MNPVALFDALNCAAIAIGESESGRPDPAADAWLDAGMAADGLFMPATAADAALSVILNASGPVRYGDEGRMLLRNALHVTAKAVLFAMEGQTGRAALTARGAFTAAGMLPACLRDAVTTLLAEIQRMAEAGDGVTA